MFCRMFVDGLQRCNTDDMNFVQHLTALLCIVQLPSCAALQAYEHAGPICIIFGLSMSISPTTILLRIVCSAVQVHHDPLDGDYSCHSGDYSLQACGCGRQQDHHSTAIFCGACPDQAHPRATTIIAKTTLRSCLFRVMCV